MKICGGYKHSGRRLGGQFQSNYRVRLAALFWCIAVLAAILPAPAAADGENRLSDIVRFESITLHYAGSVENPVGEEIQNRDLLRADDKLALRYTYTITEEQCKQILPDVRYYLEVSPHLVLPKLQDGSPLSVESENGQKEEFGRIYADGQKAWVCFAATETDSNKTILSDYDGLSDAYFYLNCGRAGDPPTDESPIDGQSNLYAMKFENKTQLQFGYAEHEPIKAKAKIEKSGSLEDKTISWEIQYTPWQNPAAGDGVALETPFELRDEIDTGLHTYVDGSAVIQGEKFTVYNSREDIPENAGAYMLKETSEDGKKTVLIFGGTKLNAGAATQGNPAELLKITYQTSIRDELLLPGSGGAKKVANAADLFAAKDGAFNSLNISSKREVSVPQPKWLTKTGQTTRHTDGTGSATDWTVTFQPNGFSFEGENKLTLHDELPQGSTLVKDSVKVDGSSVTATQGTGNDFTVSSIQTNARPVTITYQTQVPEEMYDSGTSLGNNEAWFTFDYGGVTYTTPKAATPVGSGDGSGTPGTATLVKENSDYNAAERTIAWTVKINPHKANLQGGTFTDDLGSIGKPCADTGHKKGLELAGSVDGIKIQIDGKDPTDAERTLINLQYQAQKLTVTVGAIGRKTITLAYTTKVCDPCIFANNTGHADLTNTISTEDMIIGSSPSAEKRKVSADSTAVARATVLTKKAPVYDYSSGTMKWTVEVDEAGLPMEEVVLTDTLPKGLTYIDGSFQSEPALAGAAASAAGQELRIRLGQVTQKTTVTFDTKVDAEILGFSGDKPVVVENTIRMNGKADGIEFAEVSHKVQQSFSNHGLVKSSQVDNQQELIHYEVLINPFGLALPDKPSLADTLDKRLQLDTDTLRFYKAKTTGTTENTGQKPGYEKIGDGQSLKIAGYDPAANCFTVQLPIDANSREAYVLSYTADIIDRQAGGYSNSVRFDGGSVLLGGSKENSASVGGGGGGGGGGVAARKAEIAITKNDSENQKPLAGVTFTLYQWDSEAGVRGLPFAQGKTDAQGKLAFKVTPKAVYELEETESISGYGSIFGWGALPEGVTKTENGLLIQAGAAKSKLALTLTNEAHTTDLVFRLVNQSGIPMAGKTIDLFTSDPAGDNGIAPARTATVSPDGTVKFRGVRRGASCFIRMPGQGIGDQIMEISIPADANGKPKVRLPGDDVWHELTEEDSIPGFTPIDEQWDLTVSKVISGSETPLAGATIGLYADENCRDLIKTEVSDQKGSVTFSGVIKGCKYWLKETAAPSGYELDSAVYEGTEDGTPVTIANTPKQPAVNPDDPGSPTIPEATAVPTESGTSDESQASGDPGSSSETSASGSSDSSGTPGSTDSPDSPSIPGSSGKPGTSSRPDAPGSLSASGNPDAAVSSGSRVNGSSADDADTAQTDDSTYPFVTIMLLAGISLAIMVLCGLLPPKRRD